MNSLRLIVFSEWVLSFAGAVRKDVWFDRKMTSMSGKSPKRDAR